MPVSGCLMKTEKHLSIWYQESGIRNQAGIAKDIHAEYYLI